MKKLLNFFRSMTFGLVLLALVSLCCVAGSLIPQGETMSYYAEHFTRHGLIMKMQLNDVFGSWYFLAVTVLLCLNLTLCSLVRIKNVVKAAKNAFPVATGTKNAKRLSAEGIAKLEEYLSKVKCKKTVVDGVRIYTKHDAGRYGTFVTHLAILLTIIFGAAALTVPTVTDKTCFPKESVVMDDGTEIYVDSFSITAPDGTLNYASKINVTLPDGRESGITNISVNHPMPFGSYKIYQQTYGTAGSITVRNIQTGGEDTLTLDDVCFLSLDGVNGLWFEAVYPGYLRDEDGNFTLITSTTGRYEDPVYQVLTASEGEFTPILAFPGESIEVFDLEFTVNDPVEYPGLRIKYTPPIVNTLLCLAFALMIAGLYITFFMMPVLVRVDDEGYTVMGPKPEGMRLELGMLLQNYEYEVE